MVIIVIAIPIVIIQQHPFIIRRFIIHHLIIRLVVIIKHFNLKFIYFLVQELLASFPFELKLEPMPLTLLYHDQPFLSI